MLFKPELAEKIIRGEKTETRRLKQPGERLMNGRTVYHNGRIKWEVGRTYAICPGRGKPTIKYAFLDSDKLAYWHPYDPLPSVQEWTPARIRITCISEEIVGAISEASAIREGFGSRDAFFITFAEINGAKNLTALAFALVFELVR